MESKFLVGILLLFCSVGSTWSLIYSSTETWANSSTDGDSTSDQDHFQLSSTCLEELHAQMNLEKQASLIYRQMAAYFSHIEVAKRGFAKIFYANAKEETEHFDKIVDYINLRGGYVASFNINMPPKSRWNNSAEALRDAIKLEKEVTNKIIRLHKISDKTCKDVHLTNFLENEFIDEQISSLNKLKKLLTILNNAGGQGYGEYLVDRDLFEGKISLETL